MRHNASPTQKDGNHKQKGVGIDRGRCITKFFWIFEKAGIYNLPKTCHTALEGGIMGYYHKDKIFSKKAE